MTQKELQARVRTDMETSYRFTCYPWLAWRAQGVRFTRWLKERRAATAQALADSAASV